MDKNIKRSRIHIRRRFRKIYRGMIRKGFSPILLFIFLLFILLSFTIIIKISNLGGELIDIGKEKLRIQFLMYLITAVIAFILFELKNIAKQKEKENEPSHLNFGLKFK